MNRAEFMNRLTALLHDVSPAEREEAIQYYNDYFDDAGAENEASVIASLGTPEELAKTIKAGLSDGGSGGEFTETGFEGYGTRSKDEIMNPADRQKAQGRQDYTYGNTRQSSYNGYGTQNSAWNSGAQRGSQWNGGAQGNSQWNSGAQGNSQWNSGTQGNSQWNSGAQGSNQWNNAQGGGNAAPPKQGLSGGMLALVIILIVLASPIWIGLAGGLLGLLAGIFAALFGIFVAFLAVCIALFAVSVALFVAGVVAMFGEPLGGLCLIGGSLVTLAVGLVFLWLMVMVVGVVIPACIKGIVYLFQKLFHKGGAKA